MPSRTGQVADGKGKKGGQAMNEVAYQTLIVKFSEPIKALDGMFDDAEAWGVDTLKGRVFKIASKSYAFFAYSIDAFDYQVRRKVFNRPFLNMAVSSILQPFFEFEVNSSVLVG